MCKAMKQEEEEQKYKKKLHWKMYVEHGENWCSVLTLLPICQTFLGNKNTKPIYNV